MDIVTPGLGLIFWQTVTFLIVVFVLSRVAWKPILSAIKEREDSISSALAEAKSARQEIKDLQASNENLLKEAREEREGMLREAQVTGNALIIDSTEKARTEGIRIIEDARQTIQAEKNAALAEIRNQVADLSLAIAEQLLREKLSNPTAQQELIGKYIQESKSMVN